VDLLDGLCKNVLVRPTTRRPGFFVADVGAIASGGAHCSELSESNSPIRRTSSAYLVGKVDVQSALWCT